MTTLLHGLGLDSEQILHHFYNQVTYTLTKDGGWKTPFDAERLRGQKPNADLVDAKSKKVVIEAGKKITPRLARKLAEDGVKELLVTDEHLYGQYLADELVDPKTGIIHGEAGQEIDDFSSDRLRIN